MSTTDGDRYIEALVGGRLLTQALSDEVFAGYPELGNRSPFVVERLSGEKGPDALRQFWTGCVDPAAGWQAAVEGTLFDQNLAMRGRPLTIQRAEELMGSPIIRAAILAPIDEVLYPAGDEDAEWDVETIEYVAHAVHDARRGIRSNTGALGSFAPQGYYDPISQPDGSVVDFEDPRQD